MIEKISYKNFRKALQIVVYYLLPAGLLLSMLVVPEGELKHFSVELGEWAINLFIFIMFIKPVSVFLPKITVLKKIVIWRKELGIAIFYLAFFHMVGIFIATGLWNYPKEWIIGLENIPVLFGTASLGIMALLYATSNRFSVKKLKRNWQKLHYLAYPGLLLALLHKFMIEHGEYAPALGIFGLFVILKFIEWKKSGKILKNKQ